MDTQVSNTHAQAASANAPDWDAVIVGAGISGLFQLHCLNPT